MSWNLKILVDNITNKKLLWDGTIFNTVEQSTKDYVINHRRDFVSTWREVGYELNKREIEINRQNLEGVLILDATSSPYQFINPLREKVFLYLPEKPKAHTKYLIKNLSNEPNRKIIVGTKPGTQPLLTLSTPDNVATFYFDSINYQIQI